MIKLHVLETPFLFFIIFSFPENIQINGESTLINSIVEAKLSFVFQLQMYVNVHERYSLMPFLSNSLYGY